KSDPSEQNNLVEIHPQIGAELYANLKNWLESVDAKYPIIDAEFDENKRKAYEKSIVEELLPKLEQQRKDMLTKEFKPNADWWGSIITKD
ncbi:MAG TPA: hypothetical protein PKD85_17770, partial [Saprospiraceae bacterium]|nr:hypothetical protein [Saprospiraceae bacterium]